MLCLFCITCPAARKWAPFIQDCLSGNRKVVNLFPLRPMLEAKAFTLPSRAEGCRFTKAPKNREGRRQPSLSALHRPAERRADVGKPRFWLTVLMPDARKKPGNPDGLPGFFVHRPSKAARPKLRSAPQAAALMQSRKLPQAPFAPVRKKRKKLCAKTTFQGAARLRQRA